MKVASGDVAAPAPGPLDPRKVMVRGQLERVNAERTAGGGVEGTTARFAVCRSLKTEYLVAVLFPRLKNRGLIEARR